MKKLLKGNVALCEGAVAAGLGSYFGYPITPQNEIPSYLSRRMLELGKVFVQAESEIAAANMVLGAAVTGVRAMTSSSSPGISLKQEAISYMAGMQVPALIVNVQRGGPGLGNISGSQSDYFQAVKGGGHGDYKVIVLSPNSAQEMYEMAYDAFDLAEKYRTPVIILADGIIGQMMEPVDLNRYEKKDFVDQDWWLNGAKGREPRSIKSLLMKDGVLEQHNVELQKKYQTISENEVECELYMMENVDIVVVAYGISSRIAKSAVKYARKNGVNAGLLRPKTLWPFPSKIINSLAKPNLKFLVVEMNHGQMVEDVKLAVNGKSAVRFFGKAGGGLITEHEIFEKLKKDQKSDIL
ncbi:MAG: 3-methyl-2-oxobutanoate dehydrogenase subunit VorB [Endomicrobium sp.]|jgi:2-oxoglutarate ferredoxin oxidoreductase subunit alpha|nr:3-methyl-2-oxobutanoate dehydrogenase subunit VorB [Endomicrobium sp.]